MTTSGNGRSPVCILVQSVVTVSCLIHTSSQDQHLATALPCMQGLVGVSRGAVSKHESRQFPETVTMTTRLRNCQQELVPPPAPVRQFSALLLSSRNEDTHCDLAPRNYSAFALNSRDAGRRFFLRKVCNSNLNFFKETM